MKKLKKVISALSILGILASATPAFASTNYADSSEHNFDSAWEAYNSDNSHAWDMTYGYNTSWINEDYCHTISYISTSTAVVDNASSFSPHSASAGMNKWAKIEVTHNGSYIKYAIVY